MGHYKPINTIPSARTTQNVIIALWSTKSIMVLDQKGKSVKPRRVRPAPRQSVDRRSVVLECTLAFGPSHVLAEDDRELSVPEQPVLKIVIPTNLQSLQTSSAQQDRTGDRKLCAGQWPLLSAA